MWVCKCGVTNDDEVLHCSQCNTLKSFMMKATSNVSLKPAYLNHLKTLAALSLILAILGALTFVFGILANMNRSYGEANSLIWLLGMTLIIQGLLGYGLLNAIADIAENMIDVGTYVRDLRQNKS